MATHRAGIGLVAVGGGHDHGVMTRIREASPGDVDAMVRLNGMVQRLHARHRPDLFVDEPSEAGVAERFRGWLREEFYQMLRERGTALVLSDLHFMPRLDVTTRDFVYVRWLGRRAAVPDDFPKVVKDRSRELDWWADRAAGWLRRGLTIYAFANNRYMGHAPATVRMFMERLSRRLERRPER